MHLDTIWQYPVKSMIGVTVQSAQLDEVGVVGDRTWAVRDEEAGVIANTRKLGGLMRLSARYGDSGSVTITLPGGRTVASTDPDIDAVLSSELGRAVSLRQRPAAAQLDFYRRAPFGGGDMMEELRTIFAREADEPLPDFGKFPEVVMEYETPPGALYDCYPLMIMSTSALRSLAAAVPTSVIDVRRFRPSLVVDTGDAAGHPELAWSGQRFALGTAVVEVINDCPRCAAITREIAPDVPADRAILRHVVKDLGQAVGVYARVVQPGTVGVGDDLQPL
ncbi:MAG: MOSC N-terminal beta barrel domain-containing protein [Ilumatobacteraceae bacterium]